MQGTRERENPKNTAGRVNRENATEEYIRNRYRIQQTIYRATAGGSELENGENPGN